MSVSLKTALKLSRNLLPWATTRGQTADIHFFSAAHEIVFLFKKDVVLHGNHMCLYFFNWIFSSWMAG